MRRRPRFGRDGVLRVTVLLDAVDWPLPSRAPPIHLSWVMLGRLAHDLLPLACLRRVRRACGGRLRLDGGQDRGDLVADPAGRLDQLRDLLGVPLRLGLLDVRNGRLGGVRAAQLDRKSVV